MPSLTLHTRDTVQATPRSRIIVADLDGHAFTFEAGQAVLAGLADGSVRRFYSLASSPGQARDANAIELLVRIDDHAAPDPHLERARAGTLLQIEGPFGSFALPAPLAERRLLLVAGGTGIAPLRSIMWDVLEREPAVRIDVVYSARSPEEFAYGEELTALAAAGRIGLSLTVTRDSGPSWSGPRGRISPALLAPALDPGETRCLICGPAALVADTTALLRDAGVPDDRILTETHAP